MEAKQTSKLNTTTLAYIGDAVYELAIRQMLIETSPMNSGKAHNKAIKYVSSSGQAKSARVMCENAFLSEEEEKLLKRARNHRASSRPQNADPRNYKWATGFEALIGYLYLSENDERLKEVLAEAVRIIGSDDE